MVRARDGFISRCRGGVTKNSLEQLAEYAAKIGLRGVDLLKPEEYEIPRRYGLICTMGYAGAEILEGAEPGGESCCD